MEEENTKELFLKTPNKNVATVLHDSGFFSMEEKINEEQIVYVFKVTEELYEFLFSSDVLFEDVVYVEDNSLKF